MTPDKDPPVEDRTPNQGEPGREGPEVKESTQILEFVIDNNRYALDLLLVREISEVVPITPIPRSPKYISGVINMRGEITYILNIHSLLRTRESPGTENMNIIVFVPGAANGTNVGIMVDQVTNVADVPVSDIERHTNGMEGAGGNYIKGIIRMTEEGSGEEKDRLVIWLDLTKILDEISSGQSMA